MPQFQFKAINEHGKEVSGRRNALTPEDLAAQLQSEALTPLEIGVALTSTKDTKKTKKSLFSAKNVSQIELQMFCRQMYTVIKAGIPLGVAIARLAETTRDKLLAQSLQEVLSHLNKGRALYQSLNQFPEIFNSFFINLVKVGESTGHLDTVFFHLSQYLELEVDTKNKIKSALHYPILVLAAAMIALIVITTFVIPSFAELFRSFGAALPLPTRILMAVSDFILAYWYLLLLISGAIIWGFRYWTRTEEGSYYWSRMQLKFPIIGWIIHRVILARFARLYALVLRAGLTAVDGIELVGSSTGNVYVSRKIRSVSNLVGRGNTIAKSIAQTDLFPPLVVQMITLGEDTGDIDRLLDDVADFYQREVAYDLVRLSDAIEPIMLVIMGIMVLILALGVFLPLWDMVSVVKA
jgi:MSHA biogenesis protein MshG